MSRYMWRKYKQKSKKRARLDSSHREESRKVPLTPTERAKAYRERKRLRALDQLNPLKPELNPICYLLALLGAHHFLHVSRIRVKLLTLR